MAGCQLSLGFLAVAILMLSVGAAQDSGAVSGSQREPRVTITPRAKQTRENPLERRPANIRVDTTMVVIPVTVTTPLNQVVTGLEKEHFRLFEDNVEQTIAELSGEDAPLSVGLVFDVSGSMGSKLHKSRQAAAQFFQTASQEDEFFLIQFSDRPKLSVPFTRETEEIQNRLAFSEASGRTALLDALYLAMDHMKKARNPRKAVLVLSDGGDNSSRYTQSEIKNLVREADVQVYAIGIFEPISARGRTAEELAGPSLLSELAEQTGGKHFPSGEHKRFARYRSENRHRAPQSIRSGVLP